MPRVLSIFVRAGLDACAGTEAVRAIEPDLLGQKALAILTKHVPAIRVLAGECRLIDVACLSRRSRRAPSPPGR